jgi:hypothetical protein
VRQPLGYRVAIAALYIAAAVVIVLVPARLLGLVWTRMTEYS